MELNYNYQDLDVENILDLKLWTEQGELWGLIDEAKGGIIGYVHPEHMDRICGELNRLKFLFPNGLESWQETHFEVVSFITANTIGTQDNYLTKIQESEGSTGLFDVARDWANEFEKLNAGREWDGEFFEEIEAFCKSKMS